MNRLLLMGATALALAACQSTAPTAAVTRGDLRSELVQHAGPTPPPGPAGACWVREVTPAVIETVTDQVMVTPPRTSGGRSIPATFRSETRQSIVQDRAEVWFRTPCEADMTVAFIASLQRGLKARGLYRAPVTGVMDDPTRLAIRQFQEPRGLDSTALSLAAAKELGIASTPLADL